MARTPMSFLSAMMDFFGLIDGQNRMAFGKECQSLSDDDKAYFRAGLESVGYSLSN